VRRRVSTSPPPLDRADGDLQILDDEDRVVGIENWRTAVDRYLAYCSANDIAPRDLTRLAG